MKRTTAALTALVGILLTGLHDVGASQQEPSENTIVPGVRVGAFTFGMSKDEVLRRLGKPKGIFFAGERYTLNNLPRRYFMFFGDITFAMDDDSVKGITVHSPLYKFTNGLGVGDSEEKIKQAFGNDFQLEEAEGKDFLTYEDKGLHFEIHKKNRTVMEITVNQTTCNHADSDAPNSDKAIMLSEQSLGPISRPNTQNYLHGESRNQEKQSSSMVER